MSMTIRKRTNATAELLRRLEPFGGHSDKALANLARLCDVVELEPGQVLTEEDGVGKELFLIVEGTADVEVHGQTAATAGPGQLIGEMAMLEGQRRTATVRARTPMTVVVVGQRGFRTFSEEPTIARMMATGLSERLRRAQEG